MDSTLITKIREKQVKNQENKSINHIELTFKSSNQNSTEIITLEGEGSLKVLIPV